MPTRTSVRDLMRSTVPEGTSGRWQVQRFVVSESEAAISFIRDAQRAVYPGEYTKLTYGGGTIMSDTPAECRDHYEPYWEAQQRGGAVLIHGLGLGVLLQAVLSLDNVTQVDVVELSENVIELVAPHFNDPRLQIYQGDALTFTFAKSKRWSVVWHDIWPDICADNLPDMKKLHRRYGRRCDWQGSWCRWQCERRERGI